MPNTFKEKPKETVASLLNNLPGSIKPKTNQIIYNRNSDKFNKRSNFNIIKRPRIKLFIKINFPLKLFIFFVEITVLSENLITCLLDQYTWS